ncbi:50S ribosomal protein L29 [Patescibacteria group bacterium]|nr:50S ribosomal protein L29 [Patescibacteria group bacterium]
MEVKELKNKTEKELCQLLAQNREKYRSLRFSVSAKQLKNVKEIKTIKKLIARILTILRMKEKENNKNVSK